MEQIKKLIESLPHAFNSLYWNMAETSYNEEILIAAWEENIIEDHEAKTLIHDLFDDRQLLYDIIDGKAKDVMGRYIYNNP